MPAKTNFSTKSDFFFHFYYNWMSMNQSDWYFLKLSSQVEKFDPFKIAYPRVPSPKLLKKKKKFFFIWPHSPAPSPEPVDW